MTSQRLQYVQGRERITENWANRLTRDVIDQARGEVQQRPITTPTMHVRIAQIAELVTATQSIKCVAFGSTAPVFAVGLPQIYFEPSRDFGGSIGNVTYSYTDLNTRTATGPGGVETQYLTPPLIIGEVIVIFDAVPTPFMFGDGRMWAIDPPP